tara:strand:+ start:1945 stop:9951 length:8007 start_codon:yes stop_codon:yes gene_type:complete
MTIDPKKDITPLVTRDWTRTSTTKAFFQKAVYIYPQEGVTTDNSQHIHRYEVDADGNGWALEVAHPKATAIVHKHKIENWIVQEAQSNCYPDCKAKYGEDGAPPHIHALPPETKTRKYADRYSIAVETDSRTTDGSDEKLKAIMDGVTGLGAERILKFYNKSTQDKIEGFAEDWFLSERPLSRIQVLVSLPSEWVDSRPTIKPPEVLPTPWAEIYLNTSDLQKKIDGVSSLLKKYNTDIKSFYGRVQGVNLSRQADLLSNSITTMAALMAANGVTYDDTSSNLLIFGIDNDYNFLYGQVNDGNGFNNLYLDFEKFVNTKFASNKRSVHMLSKLDELYKIYSTNEKVSWNNFFKKYLLNPPEIDFSELPRNSCPTTKDVKQAIKDANQAGAKNLTQIDEEQQDFDRKKAAMKRVLDSSSEFVGDTAVKALDGWLSAITDIEDFADGVTSGHFVENKLFKDLLNKIPVQNLIAAAMECLGFKGFDFLQLAKSFLNQTSGYLQEYGNLIAALGQVPTIRFPDDFPVADYMKDLGKQIADGLLEAVLGVLMEAIVAIINQLLDLCNECALQNEAGGKKRLDGLNFGALSLDTLGESLLAGTITGLTREVDRSAGVSQMAAEAMQEAEQYSKNPAMLLERGLAALDGEEFNAEERKQQIQEQTEEAKAQMGDFFRASSTILTPGETGNLLLGCGVGPEPVNALKNLANSFPAIRVVIADDPEYKIKKIFENVGKLFAPQSILQTVKNATDSIPDEILCLCDADDIALRKQLLSNKGLSKNQIADQVKKSSVRRDKRLKELSELLDKPNILEGKAPVVYCTMVYRDSNGKEIPPEKVLKNPADGKYYAKETGDQVFKGVKQGIIKNDHENFTYALDQTLDLLYDSVHMSFNGDISAFVPLLTQDSFREREVQRTKIVGNELVLNPEWSKMVKDPSLNYSYGALPADASVPGRNIIRQITEATVGIGGGDELVTNGVGGEYASEPGIGDPDLDFPPPPATSIRNILAAGQMQTGQQVPSGYQERDWETTQARNGRTQDGRRRATDYPTDTTGARLAEYTRLYGYSPIPVMVKEKGPKTFAPGLRNAYQDMCVDPMLFDVSDNAVQKIHTYAFEIPVNVFQAAGLDYDQINNTLNSDAGSATDIMGGVPGNMSDAAQQNFSAGMDALKQGFAYLQDSNFDLNYVVPYEVPRENDIVTDRYGITLTMASKSPSVFSTAMKTLVLYQNTATHALPEKAVDVIERRTLTSADTDPHIPQEKLFVSLNQQVWDNGTTIYRNGQIVQAPDYSQGLEIFSTTGLSEQLKNYMLADVPNVGDSTYDGLWKDFYCSLVAQISESPFMDLKEITTLNMVPMKEQGQPDNCDYPSLLDIEIIKKRIKDEYGLIQCIEEAFPNTDGLGTNKDNPFEKANLGGAVLLTIRTYVLETLLRSIFSFYYFRYKSVESIDPLLTTYIATMIKKDVQNRKFLPEFGEETIALYNRNAPNMGKEKTSQLDVALEYFVKNQIFGVSNRLSKTVGAVGDTSLDSILVEEWIPEYAIQEHIGERRFFQGELPTISNTGDDPLPPSFALKLFGDGPLSTRTIRGFETDNLFYKKTLGTLFSEYFGETDENKLGAVGEASPPRDIWNLNPTRPREKEILIKSGLFDDALGSFTPRAKANIDEPLNEEHTSYALQGKIGVSDAEKQALQTLIKLIAAAIPQIEWVGSPNARIDYQEYINEWWQYPRAANTTGISHIYPGCMLKDFSENFTGASEFTFEYDQVWDLKGWYQGLTPPDEEESTYIGGGIEPPDWVKSLGERVSRTAVRDEYWVPPSFGEPNASSRNNRYDATGDDYPFINTADQDPNIPLNDILRLRWFNLPTKMGGQAIGPWMGFGAGKWKLIDPRSSYNAAGPGQFGQRGPRRRPPSSTNNCADRFRFAYCLGLPNNQPFTVAAGIGDLVTFGVTPPTIPNAKSQTFLDEAEELLANGMPYYSLLDFDLASIPQILRWEKLKLGRLTRNTHDEDYDRWIQQIEEALQTLDAAATQRRAKQEYYLQMLRENGVARREYKYNPGTNFKNGNIIKEYYVRVEELPYQGMPQDRYTQGAPIAGIPGALERVNVGGFLNLTEIAQIQNDPDESYRFPIEQAKWRNSNYVDNGRTEFLKGVVNIDKFQEYINSRFPNGTIESPDPCGTTLLTKALIQNWQQQYEDCGEKQARELGIRIRSEGNDYVLSDFFKSVHVGVRISYVTPLKDWEPTDPTGGVGGRGSGGALRGTNWGGTFKGEACWRYHVNDETWDQIKEIPQTPLDTPFQNIKDRNPAHFKKSAVYDKSYYVREDCASCAPWDDPATTANESTPTPSSRWVHVVPIVNVEREIDPLTLISDIANTGNKYKQVRFNANGGTPNEVDVGFFQHQYGELKRDLYNELKETEEFQLLFKYMFPVDRMLSLSNIYASSYLSTFKDINNLFDGTKTNLKTLFFACLQSGNYPAGACGPSNLDFQLASLNGLPIEGLLAQLALMIAKAALLIFKGFTETFDPNIAVSKLIIQGIHLSNQLIAQGLTMANQAQQMGDAAGDFAEQFSGIGDCKNDLEDPPPDTWFDPVDQNFIPEPQTMFVSLALLPITLLPLFWPGIPITPFGLAYWGLDWKPEPNWLNSMPPSDWLNKLLSKDANDAQKLLGTDADCSIESGLPPVGSGEGNGAE